MILIDTSAWIEFFRGGDSIAARKVDQSLETDLVGIGDLIYCEVMQGVRFDRQKREIADIFRSLPRLEMVGFHIAEIAALNYRTLRSKGLTVRKTIDVLVGTFCAENGYTLIHCDRDFDLMAPHIGLTIL